MTHIPDGVKYLTKTLAGGKKQTKAQAGRKDMTQIPD